MRSSTSRVASDQCVGVAIDRQGVSGDVGAGGEARNTMALAMSSAVTMRRNEVLARVSSMTTRGIDAAQRRLGRKHGVDARSGDRAGADGVHADAERAEFHRQRLGEADHAPLRRGVRRAVRKAEAARGRGQIGDARVGAGLEQRDRALRAQELPGEIDGERALPVGKATSSQRAVGPATPALLTSTSRPPSAPARREQAVDRCRVGDIATPSDLRSLAARRARRRRRRRARARPRAGKPARWQGRCRRRRR